MLRLPTRGEDGSFFRLEIPEVPDGAWVLEDWTWHRSYTRRTMRWEDDDETEVSSTITHFIGAPREEIHVHSIDAGCGSDGRKRQDVTRKVTWSMRPFVRLQYTHTSWRNCLEGEELTVDLPRLVRGGRLDRVIGPRRHQLYMVAEDAGGSKKIRWCRIRTIAKMMGMTPDELWAKYACIFSHGEDLQMGMPRTNDEMLIRLIGTYEDKRPEPYRKVFAPMETVRLSDSLPKTKEHLWVRSWWARAVLALHQLDWEGIESLRPTWLITDREKISEITQHATQERWRAYGRADADLLGL